MGVSCSCEFVMSTCWKPCQMAACSRVHARVFVPSPCRWVICQRGFPWLPFLTVLLVLDQPLALVLPEPPFMQSRSHTGSTSVQRKW